MNYSLSTLPEPYRILNRRLRPFSLGHYLLLQRFGSSVLNKEAEPSREDLIFSVLVCSMSFGEFQSFLEQKDFLKQVEKWGKKVGMFDLKEKWALFNSYLESQLKEPDYVALKPSEGTGDWAQSLKITLVTRLGYSESESLDAPLSKALADYYHLAESEGLVRLLSPEELAAGAANSLVVEMMNHGRTETSS